MRVVTIRCNYRTPAWQRGWRRQRGHPGLTRQQEGTLADGAFPVALSGRVYCWAGASYGPIQPGDLLTTSDTPGQVMRVTDDSKAQSAIIGLAMSALT